ncbi:serine/threonine-protein kinase [Nannocystaceae bacterium ST9]
MTSLHEHGGIAGEQWARSRRDVSWTQTCGDARSRRPVDFEMSLLCGRFEIGRPLGDGSFASVYEARDLQLDRKVAIKLFTRYERDEVDAALHEARSMAKLRHPNVLTVHDIGEHRGTPFLALEYCETDLRRWLDRGPHAPARIIERFLEAGRGLAAAHAAGLVHHDFKPANVLLREDGSAAVGDFGLAQPLDTHDGDDEPEEDPAFAFGTLRYIAPERLLGQPGDQRSDQFSFCVALWEALAGEHPFTGTSAQGRYESIVAGPCVVPRVARSLVRALRRGLSPEPCDRFPSMIALLDALAAPTRRASTRWAEHGRPMLTAAGLAMTFVFGLGLAPELTTVKTVQADTSTLRVAAVDQAMARTHDLLFDRRYDEARAAYATAYRLIDAAPLSERREFIPQLVLLGDLFEKAERFHLAAGVFDDAAKLAERVGLDPGPHIARRDVAMSKLSRL